MKKLTTFFIFIFSIIIVLSVVQVAISNSLSTAGVQLAKLEEEKRFYSRENSQLKEKWLTTSSYASITQKAKGLGFVEEKSRLFLTAPLPLAKR